MIGFALFFILNPIWIVMTENETPDFGTLTMWKSTKVAIAAGLISTTCVIVLLSVFLQRWKKRARIPLHADYPAYGITGPSKLNSTIDSKLAESAQLFQYEHTKQLISHEKAAKQDKSADSEEEELSNNYSVFECPGLAETGEIEVQNPMFVESGR